VSAEEKPTRATPGTFVRPRWGEVPFYVAEVFRSPPHDSMILETWGIIGERRDREGIKGQAFTMKDFADHWEPVSLDYVKDLTRVLPDLGKLLTAKNLL